MKIKTIYYLRDKPITAYYDRPQVSTLEQALEFITDIYRGTFANAPEVTMEISL